MQEASFIGFVKTIFYIIAIFYVMKFLARLFLPMLVKKIVQKVGENVHQHQQNAQRSYGQKSKINNDEIIIDTANFKKSRETKNIGDYVDYEEIE